MNRNNFLVHLALAIVLILVAAFFGQLNRWRKQWSMHIVTMEEKKRPQTSEEIAIADRAAGRPEVLVKFKSGLSHDAIEALTARLNDRVEDLIENAPGWAAIDDLDDASPAATVEQYRAMPGVEYAEENYEINIPDQVTDATDISRVRTGVMLRPKDPMFSDQWALANSGQRGGKQGADISATLAWAKTTAARMWLSQCSTAVLITHTKTSPETCGYARLKWIRITTKNSERSTISMATTLSTVIPIRWMRMVTALIARASSAPRARTASALRGNLSSERRPAS